MMHKYFRRKCSGYNLVELIIFIVLLAIVISVLFPLQVVLKDVHHIDRQTEAIELAAQRMELILQKKRGVGFTNFTDPCTAPTPPEICTNVPSDFTVSATITTGWGGNNNYKIIKVTVTGLASTELKTLVAKY